MIKRRYPVTLLVLYSCVVQFAAAQTTPKSVEGILAREIQPTPVTAFEVQKFLVKRIPRLPAPANADGWIAEEARVRADILNSIVFHGWPRSWVNSPPVFELMGSIQTDGSYRLLKFRYEIVPGFWSTALLYEPERIQGKVPAILNLDGHFRSGKAAEWVQKRCINFAKRGILALNLEWFGFGELSQPYDSHDYAAGLDLVGANALGLFYLAMRRGLDYLAALPEVDSGRLGVTGLSGGGWQTIVLAALDPRVRVAVEVAGFEALQTAIFRPRDNDEVELDATDFCEGRDYPDLVAMRAPRPTLLIHNVADGSGYRSALAKPQIYDEIKPFFKLLGDADALAWHENLDPGTHNYQLDNRQHAYAFFTRYFTMPITKKEIPSDAEIKSYQQLAVGVPKDNLTVLGLAREFASKITRQPIPTEPTTEVEWARRHRARLRAVVRYEPVRVTNAWRMWNMRGMDLESLFYRLDYNNGLSATAVWMKPVAVPSTAPVTIVLNDNGRKEAGADVSNLLNRGEQVLALDLIFNGEMRPQKPDPTDYELTISTTGSRPLGLETAQLIGAADWLKQALGNKQVRLETGGPRSQVIALVAAAIEPSLFSEVVTSGGMKSLAYLLDKPVPFRKAPE
ncbi:MAG: alpha/beta hydrolase family protein, partial [Terriglobia bacterium]